MRSTLDIIIAVKESQPVEYEELRLAFMALSSIEHFISGALNDLIEAVEDGKSSAKLKAGFAAGTRERMFQALKADPTVWLGPGGIPGNPEHDQRYRVAKAVAKAAGVL